jgi:tetratricopeptide (TPR) repeat protein
MKAFFRRWIRPQMHWRRILAAVIVLALAGGAAYYPLRQHWLAQQWRQAEAAYQQRDFVSARDCLRSYLIAFPNSFEARLLMARLALRAGFQDEAAVQLDLCDALKTLDVEAETVRRMLRTREGDLQFEAWLWGKVDAGDPQAACILETLARAYHKNYLLHRMQRALDQLLELEPAHIEAYLSRGWTYERRFNHLIALEDYDRALSVEPQHFDARLHKANVLIYLAKPNEALPIFEELRRDRPQDPRVLLGLFQTMIKNGHFEEARGIDAELARLFPKDLPILTERGRFYLELGDAERAETVLRAATIASPFDYQAHFALHRALQQLGKFAEADKLKDRLKQIEFDLNQMGDLSEQLQKAPFDADVRCVIAQVFLRSGEVKEGLSWLKTVLQIQPRHGAAHRTLAEYYELNRQPGMAEQHRRLAGLSPPSQKLP